MGWLGVVMRKVFKRLYKKITGKIRRKALQGIVSLTHHRAIALNVSFSNVSNGTAMQHVVNKSNPVL